MSINEYPISLQETLTTNLGAVRTRIAEAAGRVGRTPEEITLVAVSKTRSLEMIKMAYDLGVTDFGENRVQEALHKVSEFRPQDIRWHMIGHVQTNKAGKVAGSFDCIQSVDSLHLAEIVNRHAQQLDIHQPILLQVNISGEESKEGMAAGEVVSLARQIVTLPHVEVRGLMTIAPLVQDAERVRPVFRALRLLRDRLRAEIAGDFWHHLSMGMTDDYHIAIEEGATIVRIGRAIFGERVKKGDPQ